MSELESSTDSVHQILGLLAGLNEATYRISKPLFLNQIKMSSYDLDRAVEALRAEQDAKAVASVLEGKPLFTHVSDLLQRPTQPNWLVQSILETDSAAMLYGPSGVGKSFKAADTACCVATGKDWYGHKVLQGAVFYVCGEGHSGMAMRFKAWQDRHGVDLAGAPLFLSSRPVTLPDDNELQRLMDWIDSSGHVPRLIVFDTLARSLAGDENSSRDVGAFVQCIDALRIKYGCCVLIVHHSGHSATERARGSSALRAAMDTELSLTVQDEILTLSVTKQKNHEPPAPKAFTLESVVLPWTDEDGQAICSAVLVEAEGSVPAKRRNRRRLTRQEDAVLKALLLAIDEQGEDPSAAIRERFGGTQGGAHWDQRVVSLGDWRKKAYPVLDSYGDKSPDAKRKTFQRVRRKLQNQGYVQTLDEFWWPICDSDGQAGRDKAGQSGTIVTLSRDDTGHTPLGVSRLSRLGTFAACPDDLTESSKVPNVTSLEPAPDHRDLITEPGDQGPPDWLWEPDLDHLLAIDWPDYIGNYYEDYDPSRKHFLDDPGEAAA